LKIIFDGVCGLLCRYSIGGLYLPYFTEWVKKRFNVDVRDRNESTALPDPANYPEPILDPGKLKIIPPAAFNINHV